MPSSSTQTKDDLLKEIERLTKVTDDLHADVLARDNDNVALRNECRELEGQVRSLKDSLKDAESLRAIAEEERAAAPTLPVVQTSKQLDSKGAWDGVSMGALVVQEETGEDGKVSTPGMMAFQYSIQFRNDTGYSLSSLISRATTAINLAFGPQMTGPIDKRTNLPSFQQLPPFSNDRVLKVLVVLE